MSVETLINDHIRANQDVNIKIHFKLKDRYPNYMRFYYFIDQCHKLTHK